MKNVWKKKLHRGPKEGNVGPKKSQRASGAVKQSIGARATADANPTTRSCLKKPQFKTVDSIAGSKKSESDSTEVVSKASSTVDSVNDRTVSTCGCSSRSKKVRFDDVSIRHYNRIASDNPSCSSGPPIG